MRAVILISSVLIFTSSCSVEKKTERSETVDCFSSLNFTKLKDYIQATISTSGMGKFYVEYPPDESQVNDGNKHPSKHPENVYDILYNNSPDQIIFKNKKTEFIFKQESGLMRKKQLTTAEQDLADNLFCHILAMSDKK